MAFAMARRSGAGAAFGIGNPGQKGRQLAVRDPRSQPAARIGAGPGSLTPCRGGRYNYIHGGSDDSDSPLDDAARP
ncbi:hypothetical protein STAQ_45130 [Allostella sp. ATCC 35155]|nr:hypothetical protein STAQ_45130 [Stella sp. ATCC 35155]